MPILVNIIAKVCNCVSIACMRTFRRKWASSQAVSASVKGGSVSHRQVGLVAQLVIELRAVLASNATMLLQPLKCIAMPQQHIHSSSKANA